MSSPSPSLPLGQVIGSRYRVQSLIGRGGMGMVYAATHELTGRRVALKVMLSDGGDSPVLQERFLSEARIAATVRHPNIVDVLDMGVHENAPYLVMELLEGVSLEKVLEEQRRLSVEQTLAWLLPIIGALSVLHEVGIVHRDVKPSNIFLSSLPRHPMRPKLLDFGLARVVSDLRLTRSGSVIGTPLYMAPEHAAGLPVGPQADIWSIGVVLYEALAGASPFRYTDRSSLATQVLAGAVRPISEVRPDLPELLAAAVGRALQRDLALRYRDMRGFAQALHAAALKNGIAVPHDPDPIGLPDYGRWQSGERLAATTREQVAGGSQPGSSGPWAAGSRSDALARTASRLVRRRLSIFAALGLVLAAAVAAWFAARSLAPPVARREPADNFAPAQGAAAVPSLPPASTRPTVESIRPRQEQVEPVREESRSAPESAPQRAPGRRASTRKAPRAAPDVQPSRQSRAKPGQEEVEAEWK